MFGTSTFLSFTRISCLVFTVMESSNFDCILFDLDDTLYSGSSGIAEACRKNIDEFLVMKFGFSQEIVPSLRKELYKTYGSSLVGLRALGYEIDADEYHRYVHGRLPYEVLQADPALRNILLSIPQRKLIFTNSDKAHATKVLRKLEIEDCFEEVICFESMNMEFAEIGENEEQDDTMTNTPPQFYIKPSAEAMSRAILIAKADPNTTLFFDDNVRNIVGAKAAGLNTVLVGKSIGIEAADYVLENIHNVRQVIPEIWNNVGKTFEHEKKQHAYSINRVDSFEATPIVA